METPGITAKHAVISDACRSGRTDAGAFEEAVRRLREEYELLTACWPVGKDVKFHLILSIDRPINVPKK